MPSHEIVRTLLDEYGGRTRELLFDYVPDREPRRYLYDLVADYPRRGGRALRPSLCIATACAFGGRPSDALNTAASIELLHNAMLVHDDVQDESEERRGAPALHVRHGVPLAINAGDMLSMLSLGPLLENRRRLGSDLALRIVAETARMARESAEGQALELGWRRDNSADITESDYLTMVLKKTCWLAVILPCRAGMLIGSRGRTRVDVDVWLRIGFLIGAAFQIQDDLLNLVGDSERYGKELSGDIFEGKRTLMLIHLLQAASGRERRRILAMLGTPRQRRRTEDVRFVRTLMDRDGCIGYARRFAHALAGAAEYELTRACADLPPSRDLDFLHALPSWVIARS